MDMSNSLIAQQYADYQADYKYLATTSPYSVQDALDYLNADMEKKIRVITKVIFGAITSHIAEGKVYPTNTLFDKEGWMMIKLRIPYAFWTRDIINEKEMNFVVTPAIINEAVNTVRKKGWNVFYVYVDDKNTDFKYYELEVTFKSL